MSFKEDSLPNDDDHPDTIPAPAMYPEMLTTLDPLPFSTILAGDVREFHERFGFATRDTPTIPPDDEVRFRLRFMAEEFLETLFAALDVSDFPQSTMWARDELACLIEKAPIEINLPEFIDGLADQDYINEGTRLCFGVDGGPVHDEVQRANMAKEPGGRDADGKILKAQKPPGWTPPDIRAVLIAQGWTPPEGK